MEDEKYCTNCGAELRENAKFCASCGKPVNIERPKVVIPETTGGEEDLLWKNTFTLPPKDKEPIDMFYKIFGCILTIIAVIAIIFAASNAFFIPEVMSVIGGI